MTRFIAFLEAVASVSLVIMAGSTIPLNIAKFFELSLPSYVVASFFLGTALGLLVWLHSAVTRLVLQPFQN
jgi:hypothetical protein